MDEEDVAMLETQDMGADAGEATQPGFLDQDICEHGHDDASQPPAHTKRSANGDLKKLFAAAAARPLAASSVSSARAQLQAVAGDMTQDSPILCTSQPQASQASQTANGGGGRVLLSAFKLSLSPLQEVSEAGLAPPLEKSERLETCVMVAPVPLINLKDAVPLLEASLPVLPSGKAIFKQLPAQWLDVSGRNDALGTRCLFACRRHEHSVFEPVPADRLLQVPQAAREWQLPVSIQSDFTSNADSLAEDPWVVQLHPERFATRVLVRPGALLLSMLRRGTALPAARFTWRVTDRHQEVKAGSETRPLATPLGEFSILSNLEDAACTQPPRFQQYPLRREQLRSLGWMLAQERKRKEPFVTELRHFVSCPDAPHWRLEGSLRCEYVGVKGGVLADAIGYGKTACTIGLIDHTKEETLPKVPQAFSGFVPTRATLILAPTNLHAQWLAEITKFTGDTLKVLSVPTCAQLKRLSLQEIADADVVVATYRLFYSSPYLKRLEELARNRRPGFSFPKGGVGATAGSDWAKAYRTAFEALPSWAARLMGCEDPVTPAKFSGDGCILQEESSTSRRGIDSPDASVAPTQSKKRRLTGKQVSAAYSHSTQPCEASQAETVSAACWPGAASATQYVPLEAFWWRRVVCDEFHELLSRYPPAQVAVELFHADYKWGLSGTPPCQTLAQIRKAAGFLGVQLPSSDGTDREAEEPRKVAQEWLDAFVRRNTAELPPLEEEEQIVPVRQMPKERALYAALTANMGSQGLTTDTGGLEVPQEIRDASRSASGLLKLCSHFCASGAADVLTAADECERQLAMRREEVRSAEREVRSQAERAASTMQLIRHFEPYFAREANASNCANICKEAKPGLAARLKFLGASTSGSKADLIDRLFLAANSASCLAKERALQGLFDARGKAAGLPQDLEETGGKTPAWQSLESPGALEPDSSAGKDLVLKAIQEAIAACPPDPPTRCTRLRTNLGMPKWSGKEELGSDTWRELEETNKAWLKERVNYEKLQKVIVAWKTDVQRCALRLLALQNEVTEKLQRVTSFQSSLHASQMAALPEELEAEKSGSRFAKYGSKIEALVKHIKKVQAEDSGCKLICFVQWEDLKRKIGSALEEFGVTHLALHGSVWARRSALMRFQYEEDSPRMLLLSLEESASGTNLTAANHVIIVHPMEASTKEEAVAFEMQAVGRVRRPGQQRKIHIWRFVTVDTIEQEITEEHQRELWDRQQTKVMISQGLDVAAESDVEVEDDGIALAQDTAAGNLDGATQRYMPDAAAGSRDIAEDASTQCYMAIDQDALASRRDSSSSTTKGIEWEDGCGGIEEIENRSRALEDRGGDPCATQAYLDPDATQRF